MLPSQAPERCCFGGWTMTLFSRRSERRAGGHVWRAAIADKRSSPLERLPLATASRLTLPLCAAKAQSRCSGPGKAAGDAGPGQEGVLQSVAKSRCSPLESPPLCGQEGISNHTQQRLGVPTA